MARVKTNFQVEETLTERVRRTAERMRWSMADATEIAYELFLKEFENAKVISVLTFEKDPDASQLPTPAPVAEAEAAEVAQ
jgi:hypothetical protein